MRECLNLAMRDRLPELAHGRLPAAEADAVRAHADECAVCGADLAALQTARLVLRAQAPRMDVAAIAAAVSAATRAPVARSALRVENGGGRAVRARGAWASRHWLAAAASILVVFSLSLAVDRPRPDDRPAPPSGEPVAVPPVTGAAPVPAETEPAGVVATGIVVGDGFSDLSTDDLSLLLAELEAVEAIIAAEPATSGKPIVNAPEVM